MHSLISLFIVLNLFYYRERNAMQKVNRRLERKFKEMTVQAEEERRHADQNKEQVCFISL